MVKTALADIDARIEAIISTRSDPRRESLVKGLVRGREPTVVEEVVGAFARRKKDRWLLPSVLGSIHRAGGKGVKEALRPLLADRADPVRYGAAQVVEAKKWGDDFLSELRKLVALETKKKNRSGALGPGLGALRAAKSPEVTPMLSSLARRRSVASSPWYGLALDVLADRRAPSARPIFEKVASARTASRHAKLMAAVGLAKLGDRAALDRIRLALDGLDLLLARRAALELRALIGTPHAMNRDQVERLAAWYDAHGAEVTARFAKRKRARR